MTKIEKEATVTYFEAIGGGKTFTAGEFTSEFIAKAERLRHEVRRSEGGGGMCHVMSDLAQAEFGWPMLSVAYLCPEGDIICAAHVISVLPDGSMIDWTRDQFGEGHSVSYISKDDPAIGRYRPEFYEDFHPGHPDDEDGLLDAWLDTYSGRTDCDEQDRLREERGRGWWLESLDKLDEYDAEQDRLATEPYEDGGSILKF